MVWIFSFVAILGWGMWAVTLKMALHHLSPMAVETWCFLAYMTLSPLVFLVGRATGTTVWWSSPGVAWSAASAALATVATCSFLFAAHEPKVPISIVTSITSINPVVTVLFAWLALGEALTWKSMVGIATIIVGVALLQL